jgi:hypothetical protein
MSTVHQRFEAFIDDFKVIADRQHQQIYSTVLRYGEFFAIEGLVQIDSRVVTQFNCVLTATRLVCMGFEREAHVAEFANYLKDALGDEINIMFSM